MINIKIVTINEDNNLSSAKTFVVNEGTILNALISTNSTFHAPCGGNDRCHKCMVEVEYKGVRKKVQSCLTQIKEGMTLFLKNDVISYNQYINVTKESNYVLCLDLGTTTLVFYVVDINNKEIVFSESIKNPQSIFGDDVISRIQYSNLKGTNPLFASINSITENEIIKLHDYNISELYICGNPTMLHLFLNKEVKSIGEYPYTPLFLDKQELLGSDLKLSVKKVCLLPSFSSFVGSDLSAGVLKTDLVNGNNILIDLGTNGEMVLHYKNKIYVTSTAAGPAFEGVGIECGVGAVDGAISHIEFINKKLVYSTINNKKPIGIVGSALLDIIAILRKQNFIDSFGKLQSNEAKYFITDKIYITQKDIRSFQLAKSAIRTGLDILLKTANVNVSEIDKVYIAGGFGHYLNIDSAISIGLLPESLKEKYINVGNSAGLGTVLYALDKTNIKRKQLDEITKVATIVALNSNIEFLDRFTDNMEL